MLAFTIAFLFCVNVVLGFEDYTTDGICNNSLLNTIQDSQFSSSSYWASRGNGCGPWRARLNSTFYIKNGNAYYGAWVSQTNNQRQYIQVEFNEISEVRAIVTLARDNSDSYNQYVKSYLVLYSKDCRTFETVKDENGGDNVPLWSGTSMRPCAYAEVGGGMFQCVSHSKVFAGNRDTSNMVTNRFSTPLEAKCIRINPLSWYIHISMRFDLFGCPDKCVRQHLLSTVPDSQFSASSHLPSVAGDGGPWRARLNSTRHTEDGATKYGGWVAATNDQQQYIQRKLEKCSHCISTADIATMKTICLSFEQQIIQKFSEKSCMNSVLEEIKLQLVNLLEFCVPSQMSNSIFRQFKINKEVKLRLSEVRGIVTKARDNADGYNQYVTSYRVLYSIDCERFQAVENPGGTDVIFVGNEDTDNSKTNWFSPALNAKCIRINPLSWHNHVSLRFELIGCLDRRCMF
ncbi:HMCT-like protein [Mya arenaria]|uniref:HMCT-like protein n=1 Tax=Mya arenaria TaxID=6604 RepID=A0ABY7DGL0_MYAAR|nr:HMCT-like protein [Mya arenaria]